jgi:tripartite ATP-independent transporter DctP family solute receptor
MADKLKNNATEIRLMNKLKYMKRASAVAVATVMLNGQALADDVYHIKLGHTGAPNHHYQTISEMYAEKVKEATDGNVIIDVYPSDQLGTQLESVEGTMYGTHDMVLTSEAVLSNWAPDMGILNLPFLFDSLDDYQKVMSSEVGNKFAQKMTPFGVTVIGWWDNGMRHVTNSAKPIEKPEDLKGMKIRVPEGEIFVETFKALGAGPTVISFGELYSALQLGTVDGQENPPAHILTQKFYEVQDYVSRTGHIHLGSPLIMNTALLERLPEDYAKAVVDIAMEMGPVHTKMVQDLEVDQWKEVAATGMKINDVDLAPFKAAVEPVYTMFKAKLDGDLIEAVQQKVAE